MRRLAHTEEQSGESKLEGLDGRRLPLKAGHADQGALAGGEQRPAPSGQAPWCLRRRPSILWRPRTGFLPRDSSLSPSSPRCLSAPRLPQRDHLPASLDLFHGAYTTRRPLACLSRKRWSAGDSRARGSTRSRAHQRRDADGQHAARSVREGDPAHTAPARGPRRSQIGALPPRLSCTGHEQRRRGPVPSHSPMTAA